VIQQWEQKQEQEQEQEQDNKGRNTEEHPSIILSQSHDKKGNEQTCTSSFRRPPFHQRDSYESQDEDEYYE